MSKYIEWGSGERLSGMRIYSEHGLKQSWVKCKIHKGQIDGVIYVDTEVTIEKWLV